MPYTALLASSTAPAENDYVKRHRNPSMHHGLPHPSSTGLTIQGIVPEPMPGMITNLSIEEIP